MEIDGHKGPRTTNFEEMQNVRQISSDTDADYAAAIDALHARCGVYTRAETVRWFLDAVGWTSDHDLSCARLLEPAAGDGAFLVEAVDRLCHAFRNAGIRRTARALLPRISAFEIHPVEAAKARDRVARVLRRHGTSKTSATRLAATWVTTDDFLLSNMEDGAFSHIVGNPPYVRWSRVPRFLRKDYEEVLPGHAAKGDLCLAFLARSLRLLANHGQLGFLCSDRWLYSAYADEFRAGALPSFVIEKRIPIHDDDVFENRVDAYPIKLVMRKRKRGRRQISRSMNGSCAIEARRTYERWLSKHPTLQEAGCRVRVGPALGPERAFVGTADDLDVEEELLHPYVGPKELGSDRVAWKERLVICMHDDDGKLRCLDNYPRLAAHLKAHRTALENRAVVRNGASWHQPIDRVIRSVWSRPKILIPEMSKTPRVVVDHKGMIPSHGIYAIFSDEWPVDALAKFLRGGVLMTTLQAIAPRGKGGHLRAYARFLRKIPLTSWKSVPADLQNVLKADSWTREAKKALTEYNDLRY